MPIATSGPQGHSDHRVQLIKDIEWLQTNRDPGTSASDALPSLLTSMTSYLKYDQNEDDFGDVGDEDLILAETSDATVGPPGQDLKRPWDLEDGSPSKKLKTENGSASTELARRILKDTWGFPAFRHKQEKAIARLIDGGSAVVVFPTGGGKSLVYQIPALAFDHFDKMHGGSRGGGVTLVVSPLIALMKVRNPLGQLYPMPPASRSEGHKLKISTRTKWMPCASEESVLLLWTHPRLERRGLIRAINYEGKSLSCCKSRFRHFACVSCQVTIIPVNSFDGF